MPRKMILEGPGQKQTMLTETRAENEEKLQELIKDNPELIPIEEFGMTGPVMVVGRETALQSGKVDLVALARSGELLVIEFKTGPQNTDFRAALAQLLDYGSDLWQMSFEEFERAVAVRYFHSTYCHDHRVQRKSSLGEAANAIWEDLSEDEMEQLRESLTKQLQSGALHYVLMAQRFTDTISTTTEYLNTITPTVNFWGVELVRFTGEAISAFESRTVLRPPRRSPPGTGTPTDETQLLAQVQEGSYRECLTDILAACRGLGLRLNWGSAGTSIRVPVPEMPGPLTIAWLFPPGKSGWMGLQDLTLGFDPSSAANAASVHDVLEEYLSAVMRLPGVEEGKVQGLRVYHLPPEATVSAKDDIIEILAKLVGRINDTHMP